MDQIQKTILNLKTVYNSLETIKNDIIDFDKIIQQVISILEIPDNIEHELAKLDDLLFLVDKTLMAISIIPAIATPTKVIDQIVKDIKLIVHPQKVNVEKIDNKYIEPIRDKVEEFHNRIEHIINEIDNIDDKLLDSINKLEKIIVLIKDNHELLNTLLTICNECDPIIQTTNTILIVIIQSINQIKGQFNKIIQLCKLKQINNDINVVISKLHFIDQMVKPVNKVLDEKITIPYSVKVKVQVPKTKKVKDWKSFWNFVWKEVTVWEWEWKVETQNFSFTVNQVLSGIDGIIEELEKEFEKEVNKIINPILKSVNLEIKIPSIPGLEQIEKELNSLKDLVEINSLNKLEQDLEDFVKNINQLCNSLDKINKLI